MILRYKIDNARLRARLDHASGGSDPRVPALVVIYGTKHRVCRLEARRDCELVSATHRELEELRGARYDIPLARDFREVTA